VNDLHRELEAVDHAFHMEQAGHVRRDDVLDAVAVEIVHAVVAHLRRDSLVSDTEATAKTAALVRSVELD
jgi:hypothetical protein